MYNSPELTKTRAVGTATSDAGMPMTVAMPKVWSTSGRVATTADAETSSRVTAYFATGRSTASA